MSDYLEVNLLGGKKTYAETCTLKCASREESREARVVQMIVSEKSDESACMCAKCAESSEE